MNFFYKIFGRDIIWPIIIELVRLMTRAQTADKFDLIEEVGEIGQSLQPSDAKRLAVLKWFSDLLSKKLGLSIFNAGAIRVALIAAIAANKALYNAIRDAVDLSRPK